MTGTQGPAVRGDARVAVRADLARRYRDGASVRKLAREVGKSYGFVYRMLEEAGVTMRPRGGQVRP
jgi:transposase-like protein